MAKQKDPNATLMEDGLEGAREQFNKSMSSEEYLNQIGIGPKRGNGSEAPHEPSWRDNLLTTGKTKTPQAILANAMIALREALEWQGVLAYDQFALVTMQMQPPPWLQYQDNTSWKPVQWSDRDDVLTAEWLQHQGINVSIKVSAEAVEAMAKYNNFHPIKDYLGKLKWDGVKRIESFAINYLGAADTPYHRAVSKCIFVAGVARIIRPGCKVDTVTILEGTQGKGKSSAIEALFTPWFTDDIAELGTKDAAMQLRSAWCIEIAELASMTRGEIEKVKAFVARKIDRFRPSYGRRVIEVPRESVLFGTTNLVDYLKDETGGRRYWSIDCEGKIDLDAIKRDRDQLWAEAVVEFNGGAEWWLSGDVVAAAQEQQAQRLVEDPWHSMISQFVEDDIAKGKQDSVSIGEVLTHLGIECARWDQAMRNRVARCLMSMGWKRYRVSEPPREWRYRRGDILTTVAEPKTEAKPVGTESEITSDDFIKFRAQRYGEDDQ